MPLRYVFSQKSNEQLDDRMVAEGREREPSTLSSQDTVFVIPRTSVRPGTKTVRGRFVAAEVARDVRHDVHARNTGLEGLEKDRQSCCNT